MTDTEPGVKGDTVSNVTKAATLETGAVVQVPLFVNVGDRIKVDPREARYISRALEPRAMSSGCPVTGPGLSESDTLGVV